MNNQNSDQKHLSELESQLKAKSYNSIIFVEKFRKDIDAKSGKDALDFLKKYMNDGSKIFNDVAASRSDLKDPYIQQCKKIGELLASFPKKEDIPELIATVNAFMSNYNDKHINGEFRFCIDVPQPVYNFIVLIHNEKELIRDSIDYYYPKANSRLVAKKETKQIPNPKSNVNRVITTDNISRAVEGILENVKNSYKDVNEIKIILKKLHEKKIGEKELKEFFDKFSQKFANEKQSSNFKQEVAQWCKDNYKSLKPPIPPR